MNFNEKTVLGRTGLRVGKLGISSSFGAKAEVFEEAFEHGCNYFTLGTFIKGSSPEMKKAIREIIKKGKREDLVLALTSYAHAPVLTEKFFKSRLKKLGIEQADILNLGYFMKRPVQSIIDGAVSMKEKGLVRFIGILSHKRKLFAELHKEGIIDLFHVRYNAAHRGAETDVFPKITGESKPGIVSYTATRWKQLINPKKTPPGEKTPTATDCYRFVLSNPSVDVCMMGVKNRKQFQENLTSLDLGPMNEEELAWMRRVGDFLCD
jgi:predicted aldo/keto reductase-like oxidoreductase